jgi:hypothetical protein
LFQIFRQEDRPRYRRAFGICIGVLSAGLALAAIRWVDDTMRKRREKREKRQVQVEEAVDTQRLE